MNESTPEAVVPDWNYRELGTFDVKPYQADGGYTIGSVLQLCGGLGFVGILLGGLAHFVSQYFWFILLFPAAIGFVVGLTGMTLIGKFRIRNPTLCAIAGLAAGVFAMTTMHYMDYRAFQQSFIDSVGPEVAQILTDIANNLDEYQDKIEEQPEEIQLMIRDIASEPEVQQLFAVDSFVDYMNYTATVGVELSRRPGQNGINLGFVGSYIYWAVEMMIVAGIAFVLMRTKAGEPFCVECLEWKQETNFGPFQSTANLSETLEAGSVQTQPPKPEGTEDEAGDWTVAMFTCDECSGESGVDLIVRVASVDGNGVVQQKDIKKLSYPSEALVPLTVALSAEQALETNSEDPLEDSEDEGIQEQTESED